MKIPGSHKNHPGIPFAAMRALFLLLVSLVSLSSGQTNFGGSSSQQNQNPSSDVNTRLFTGPQFIWFFWIHVHCTDNVFLFSFLFPYNLESHQGTRLLTAVWWGSAWELLEPLSWLLQVNFPYFCIHRIDFALCWKPFSAGQLGMRWTEETTTASTTASTMASTTTASTPATSMLVERGGRDRWSAFLLQHC